MFAVIKTGGKQYRVQAGETINVEKLAVEPGSDVRLDEVLLAGNDGDFAFGRPMIDGAVVTARVVRQHKGPKLIIFKYKSKSRYRRRTGHRQQLTQLAIQAIEIPGWDRAEAPARPARTEETAAATESAAVAVAPTPDFAGEAPLAYDPAASSASVAASPESAVEHPLGSAAPSGDVVPTVDMGVRDVPVEGGAALPESGAAIEEPGLGRPGLASE